MGKAKDGSECYTRINKSGGKYVTCEGQQKANRKLQREISKLHGRTRKAVTKDEFNEARTGLQQTLSNAVVAEQPGVVAMTTNWNRSDTVRGQSRRAAKARRLTTRPPGRIETGSLNPGILINSFDTSAFLPREHDSVYIDTGKDELLPGYSVRLDASGELYNVFDDADTDNEFGIGPVAKVPKRFTKQITDDEGDNYLVIPHQHIIKTHSDWGKDENEFPYTFSEEFLEPYYEQTEEEEEEALPPLFEPSETEIPDRGIMPDEFLQVLGVMSERSAQREQEQAELLEKYERFSSTQSFRNFWKETRPGRTYRFPRSASKESIIRLIIKHNMPDSYLPRSGRREPKQRWTLEGNVFDDEEEDGLPYFAREYGFEIDQVYATGGGKLTAMLTRGEANEFARQYEDTLSAWTDFYRETRTQKLGRWFGWSEGD